MINKLLTFDVQRSGVYFEYYNVSTMSFATKGLYCIQKQHQAVTHVFPFPLFIKLEMATPNFIQFAPEDSKSIYMCH